MNKAAISPLPEARPFSFCSVISSCRTRSQEKRACLQHKTPRAHYKNACPLQREDQNWEGSGPALQGELALSQAEAKFCPRRSQLRLGLCPMDISNCF